MNKLELIYDFKNIPILQSHSPTHLPEIVGSGHLASDANWLRQEMLNEVTMWLVCRLKMVM